MVVNKWSCRPIASKQEEINKKGGEIFKITGGKKDMWIIFLFYLFIYFFCCWKLTCCEVQPIWTVWCILRNISFIQSMDKYKYHLLNQNIYFKKALPPQRFSDCVFLLDISLQCLDIIAPVFGNITKTRPPFERQWTLLVITQNNY